MNYAISVMSEEEEEEEEQQQQRLCSFTPTQNVLSFLALIKVHTTYNVKVIQRAYP